VEEVALTAKNLLVFSEGTLLGTIAL
jgi:hypothetical protein